jgi:pyruvate-ferredoxin/flavodoxin oxidoreductase
MANSTGCSSVWGSTYPFNPYPFPWVSHLFQDSPSLAIGLFEGHMRKMADGFVSIRRAELELSGEYDASEHEPMLSRFDWQQFDDEEFAMCPPILVVGGDGAMLDIGLQNLSRLMASGKPIRVIVLDTQVYSNTGGQACTSSYEGQVSDMAAFGAAQHGKQETRKELSLIAMAHRGVFVHQSSQASAAHLLGGVLRGLQTRRPSLFLLNCPCPPEHGFADDSATRAAKLATESRAFPLLVFDPDAGSNLAECLELDGNPALDEAWPTYTLEYLGEDGEARSMELPLTIADWAASEGRFKRQFRKLADDADEPTVFHEYLALSEDEREGLTPFIYALDDDKHLTRMSVAREIVELAEERLGLWHNLRMMAGLEVAPDVRSQVEQSLDAEIQGKLDELRTEYEAKIADLREQYPPLIARRLAEGLLRAGNGGSTIAELLSSVGDVPAFKLPPRPEGDAPAPQAAPQAAPAAPAGGEANGSSSATAVADTEEEDDEDLAVDPYIETARCTTCNECTNLNGKLFAYNAKKQAYIKDPRGGPFKDIVVAAERCPVEIIHPGTPLNPKEKDLAKWVKRAARFN